MCETENVRLLKVKTIEEASDNKIQNFLFETGDESVGSTAIVGNLVKTSYLPNDLM